jgi:polysaccharide biosynthesis transport protein
VLGLAGGIGVAFAREYFDRSFHSARQVEKELGIDCLGVLPVIAPPPWQLPRWHRDTAKDHRVIAKSKGRHRFVIDEPFSRFAETLRHLKVTADTSVVHRPNKIVGVTSARPREGRTLIAANLSEMIALSGCRALLIDGELRSPDLTAQFAPKAKAGLAEVIAGRAATNDLVWRDSTSNLEFLPTAKIPVRDPLTKEDLSPAALFQRTQLTPEGLKTLLQSVWDVYDYVILDLPPIAPAADVEAISPLIDAFILVIEFGRTSQQAVIEALNATPPVAEKLLGAVLNKADATELERLES